MLNAARTTSNQFHNLQFRYLGLHTHTNILTNHKFSVLEYDKGSFTEIKPLLKGAINFDPDEVLVIELSQLITTNSAIK